MDDIDGQSESPMSDPATLVVRLLNRQEVSWIIVTNGKLWRLYTSKAQNRARNYYEINLADITELPRHQGREAFQYLWLFFRAAAFTTSTSDIVELATHDGGVQRPSFLDTFLKDSQQHAQAVETRLKERVFVKIFLHFAEGFIVYARRNNLLKQDLEELSLEERNLFLTSFFRGTLTFLYRLLFVFYAEARNLLPASTEPEYYTYSLTSMKVRIAMLLGWLETSRDYRCRRIYSDDKTLLYDELQRLFQIVDKGKPTFNIPQYNGGLFRTEFKSGDEAIEAEAATFLATYKIPDVYLALGLDNMARDLDKEFSNERFNQATKRDKVSRVDGKSALVFIDYSELGVCQLGSVYEGLLEFKLDLPNKKSSGNNQVDELFPLLEKDQRSTQKRKSQKHAAKAKLFCSSDNIICLKQDQSDRKASGSYYTPEYIVQHIVNETIGPSLEEHFRSVSHELLVIDRQFQQQQTIPGIAQEIYENHQSTVERFFNFRVLDLAAGSGHFLVAAIDYIARKMMDQINYFKSIGRWHIILYEIQHMRERVIQEMEKQNIRIDFGKLNDLTLLKRYVLKNCIYGVDINPMAVELTKVSLWLHCFTPGAPLVYLDHHIKQGNSLIGVALDEVLKAIEAGQHLLFSESNTWAGIKLSTQRMMETNKLGDVTPEQVQASKNAYEMSAKAVAPFKDVLNVYTSRWFSNPFIFSKKRATLSDETLDLLRSKGARDQLEISETAQFTNIQKTIQRNAEKDAELHKFFHWELEFPDVFIDMISVGITKNAGFNVVIGNPPYVRQEGLRANKDFFKELYKEVYSSIADLYTYFIQRGHKMLRPNGRFGMITGNRFMRANYGVGLRTFLTQQVKLKKLIDFGDLPVFDDVTAYPMIIISANAQHNAAPIEYTLINKPQFESLATESLSTIIETTAEKLPESAFSGSSWSLTNSQRQKILDKMQASGKPLAEYVNEKIRRGILTGFNEAFVIDEATRDQLIAEDPKSGEIIKPFLIGEDVRRYAIDFQDRYLIWTYVGVPIAHYPTIYRHLQQYQPQLEKRSDKGKHWWELRHCDYYAEFERPKIIFPDIAEKCKFAFDVGGNYSINTTYMIPIEENQKYLISLLNSSLIEFFYRTISNPIRGNYLRFFTQYVNLTPIRCLTFSTSPTEHARHVAELVTHYQQYLQASNDQKQQIMDGTLKLVSHHFIQYPEASDVIYDLLGRLADQMLYLNKEKQRLQQEFLGYLVSTLRIQPDKKSGKIGLDALDKGRAVLLNYPRDYQKGEKALDFTHLSNILRDNQRHITKQIENENPLTREIESVYIDNVQKIEDIKAQLMMTDDLIDEVVYRLYGLTQEEILIGRTSKQQ